MCLMIFTPSFWEIKQLSNNKEEIKFVSNIESMNGTTFN